MERIRLKEKALYISNTYTLAVTYFLAVVIAFIVFFTGGTTLEFVNLMYIPITLAAITWGKRKSITLAIFCGLLVGPFMPLNTELNLMQHPLNWTSRIAIYIIIASITGYFADNYKTALNSVVRVRAEVIEAQLAMIYSLVKLSEARDDDTGAHIQRVAEYCRILANELRVHPKYSTYIDDQYIANLYSASPLHDVGKVAITDKILLKPGKLTPEEFEIIKTHTTLGAKTLEAVKKQYPDNQFLAIGSSIALNHHEKWDGSGYPSGLKGEDIPLSGRIMALADVYDALRSKRVYKPGYPHEKCVSIIKAESGTHYDPDIVEAFLAQEKKFNLVYTKQQDWDIFPLEVAVAQEYA